MRRTPACPSPLLSFNVKGGFTAENLCPLPPAVSTDDVAGQTFDVSTDIPYSTVQSELQTCDQQELTSLTSPSGG